MCIRVRPSTWCGRGMPEQLCAVGAPLGAPQAARPAYAYHHFGMRASVREEGRPEVSGVSMEVWRPPTELEKTKANAGRRAPCLHTATE
eukprot:scaffold43175_cov33-Tisochrysis_lutea.AAC.1